MSLLSRRGFIKDAAIATGIIWFASFLIQDVEAQIRRRRTAPNPARSIQVSQPNYDITTNGLAAYWMLDENTGTSTADWTGNGHTGTLTLGPTWVTGISNYAVSFDGANDYITVPSFNQTNISISLWVYPISGGSASAGLVTKYSGAGNRSFNLCWDGNEGSAGFAVTVGGTYKQSASLTAPGILPNLTWSHIGAYYDGSSIAVFTNGVIYGIEGLSGDMDASTVAINLGARNTAVNFKGYLDEVRVYSNAVSPSIFYRLSYQTNCTPTNTTSLKNLCADGDSMTQGGVKGWPWPSVLATNVGLSLIVTNNLAQSGQTTANMLLRQTNMSQCYSSNASANVLIAWNSNDIKSGSSDLTTFARLKAYCTIGKSVGYKVGIMTILKRSDYSGGMETYRQSVNAKIAANSDFFDYVIDLAGNVNLDYTVHPENFDADTIHPNNAGETIIAGMVKTALGW